MTDTDDCRRTGWDTPLEAGCRCVVCRDWIEEFVVGDDGE